MKYIIPPDLHHKLATKVRFNGKIYSSVVEHFLDTIKRKSSMIALKDAILGYTYRFEHLPFVDALGPIEAVVVACEHNGGDLLVLGFKDPTFSFGWPDRDKINTRGYFLTRVLDYDDYNLFLWAAPERECTPVEISCWNTSCQAQVNLTAIQCQVCGSERFKQ